MLPPRSRSILATVAATGLLLCSGIPPSSAESGGDPARVTQAAMRLFERACIRNLRQEDGLRAELQTADLRAASSEEAAPHLGGRAGTLFVSRNPDMPLAVVVGPSAAQCEVRSPIIDLGVAERDFRSMMEGLQAPKLMVRRDSEERSATGGRRRINMVFSAGAPPLEEGGARIALQARDPLPGGIALSVSASGQAIFSDDAAPPARPAERPAAANPHQS